MKRHLYEQIFRRQILTQHELKQFLLAASTARLFVNRCFGLSNKQRKQTKENYRPCIELVSRQNKFTPAPFSTPVACANKAAVADQCNYMNNKTKRNKRFLCQIELSLVGGIICHVFKSMPLDF